MTTFPALIPSTRTYSAGEYPNTAHPLLSGAEIRVRHSNTVLGVRLRLTFIAVSSDDVVAVRNHYNGRKGGFLPFAIPDEILSGVETPADFTPAGHQWRYASRPRVVDVPIAGPTPTNRHDLVVELETVPPENTIVAGARLRARVTLRAGSPERGAFFEVFASLSAGAATVSDEIGAPGAFMTATASLDAGAAEAGAASDSEFASVALLLPLNGSNGSTTFTDASLNGFTVTGYGNAQISTAQSKWGGSSLLLDGTGDYLVSATSSEFAITGDFTVEFWVYLIGTGNQSLLHVNAGGAQGFHMSSNGAQLNVDNGLVADFSSTTDILPPDEWHFIAAKKVGTDLTVYKGDTALTIRTAQDYGTPDRVQVGRYSTGGVISDAHAYFQDIRITNGVGRTIVIPTAAFPTA